MLGETWLGKHFEITCDRSTHYGLFDCGPSPVAGGAGGGTRPPRGDAAELSLEESAFNRLSRSDERNGSAKTYVKNKALTVGNKKTFRHKRRLSREKSLL
jgi:hypothetical protein